MPRCCRCWDGIDECISGHLLGRVRDVRSVVSSAESATTGSAQCSTSTRVSTVDKRSVTENETETEAECGGDVLEEVTRREQDLYRTCFFCCLRLASAPLCPQQLLLPYTPHDPNPNAPLSAGQSTDASTNANVGASVQAGANCGQLVGTMSGEHTNSERYDAFGRFIYDRFLFDIPILLDIAALYTPSNPRLLLDFH